MSAPATDKWNLIHNAMQARANSWNSGGFPDCARVFLWRRGIAAVVAQRGGGRARHGRRGAQPALALAFCRRVVVDRIIPAPGARAVASPLRENLAWLGADDYCADAGAIRRGCDI